MLRQVTRRQVCTAIVSLILLALCAGTATAIADQSPQFSGQEFSPPPFEQILQDPHAESAGPTTDTGAAEELPHHDLDRGEAIELLQSVFGEQLEGPASSLDEIEVERYNSDHIAVVSAEGAEGQQVNLLESMIPLRTENEAGQKVPVDLALESEGGELRPAEPLVEVGIPKQLGEGISLPETGIAIHVAGAPEDRSPSTVGESAAIFPNVATDSDLSVAPTPAGVETLTQLRAPDAPHAQTLELTLPPEASLREMGDGAEIVKNGSTIASIPPPTAIDAEGKDVPVSLNVSGTSVRIEASPSEAAAYPILVDPVVESYYWTEWWGQYADWYCGESVPGIVLFCSTMGSWGGDFGLNLKSTTTPVPPGSQANWNYYVPRYFTDLADPAVKAAPTSWIELMKFTNVNWWLEGESPPYAVNPSLAFGIWDGSKGTWATVASRNGTEGPMGAATVTLPNYSHVSDVKNGGVALFAGETPRQRHLWIQQALVEVTDTDYPNFASAAGPSKWFNNSASEPISFGLSDSGLGVWAVSGTGPKIGVGTTQWQQGQGCTGSAHAACPRTWTGSLSFNPEVMPTGEDTVELNGKDPIGHSTDQTGQQRLVKVKVDHTPPVVASLSGSLTETATVGSKLPSYQLNYATSDGDSAVTEIAGTVGTSGTGTGQLERPQGVAVDSSGNVWVTDKTNNRVVEYDKAGAFLRQIGTGTGNGQIKEPRGVAVTPAGNVWVAEFAPNKRLQEFNSKGEFIRSVTNANIIEPWGVAAGPNETIWVADQGSHKLLQFKEDGTYLRSSAGTSLTWPIGVAVDRFGNVWTVDESSNKVSAFDSTGNLLLTFGTTGAGNGQLSAPQGIAIAPSGNILVVDASNSRVEEFKTDGRFVRQFGASGSGTGQFKEPRGIAVGTGNTALIADAGNHRVTRWSHADFDPQSGVAKVEIKVDKQLKWETPNPGCANGSCKAEGTWTLNANQYSSGQHEVEVIATDGVGIPSTPQTAKFTVEPDSTAPSLAVTGSMTEQATLGTTRPQYKLRLRASDGTLAEPTASEGGPTAAYALDETSGTSARDASGNHTGTITAPTWAEGKYGKALSFNGTSSCLSVPNSVDLQLAGNFTLSAWVKPNNTTQWAPIFYKEAESFYSYSLFFGAFEAGHVQGYIADKPWEYAEVESPGKLTANTWAHVAMTSDGATLRLYVNGTQVDTGSAKTAMESKQPLLIGCAKNFGEYFNGQIDNVRIFNRALSASEIEADKGSAVKVPAPEGPTAAYALDETSGTSAKDAAGVHNATVSGTASWVEGKYGKALNFNGENTCASVANSSDLQLNGPFTLEAWVKPGNTTQWAPIFYKEGGEFYGYSIFFGAFVAGHIQGYISEHAWEYTEVESPGTLTANSWSHVAMTSDGTTMRLYVNGTQVDTSPASKAIATTGPLLIGCAKNFNEYFKGAIDNVRVYNRALTAAEVEADKAAAVGTSTGPMQSGIAKTEITLDGKVVDSSTGCSGENCSVAREYTLPSTGHTGKHTVVAKVTDGFGNTTSKTTEITVQPDTTKPAITTGGTLSNAPSGWVEQEGYGFTASATDSGAGVTSLALRIDGSQVASTSTSCADGGCEATVQKTIEMGAYSGGAHPAEVVATDGAGNTSTQKWTINVDPKGSISATEAAQTAEAVEATAPEITETTPVSGLVKRGEGEGGPEPTLIEEGKDFSSQGAPVETTIDGDLEDGFTVETRALTETGTSYRQEMEITPLVEGANPSTPVVVDDASAVLSNTGTASDTILHPAYDGIMAFQAIREPSAPESYSWEVSLAEGETLKELDDKHAGVFWEEGTEAMLITVQPAHDANGAAVDTTLSVEGNIVTETVHYRKVGIVLPVVAGVGWEGGFQTHQGQISEPPQGPPVMTDSYDYLSPPELIGPEDEEATASASGGLRKNFLHVECNHTSLFREEERPQETYPQPDWLWEYRCGNPFTGSNGQEVLLRAAVRGRYFYNGQEVWHHGEPKNGIGCAAQQVEKAVYPAPIFKMAVEDCTYWGKTNGGANGGQKASKGHHITAVGHFYGEEKASCEPLGCGPQEWHRFNLPPLVFYLYPNGNRDFRQDGCIDCESAG